MRCVGTSLSTCVRHPAGQHSVRFQRHCSFLPTRTIPRPGDRAGGTTH
jgi:hypothetical protein